MSEQYPTNGQPQRRLSPEDYEWTHRDVLIASEAARGAAQMEAFDLAINQLIQIVQMEPHMWRLCDEPGWLIELIAERFVGAGFDLDPRQPIPLRITRSERLARRDGWRCHYCHDPLGYGNPIVTPPEIEHVTPRCQGGTDDLENLVLSCRLCNRQKGRQTPREWLGRPCCEDHQ